MDIEYSALSIRRKLNRISLHQVCVLFIDTTLSISQPKHHNCNRYGRVALYFFAQTICLPFLPGAPPSLMRQETVNKMLGYNFKPSVCHNGTSP